MKLAALLITALIPAGAAQAQSQPEQLASQQAAPAAQQPARASASGALQQKLAPGFAKYTNEVLFGEVWPGPELSPRDRSLAVISVLIATNPPGQLRGHLTRALNNGVTPVEASGVLTHLALYAGWPSAVSALEVFDEVYTERNVDFAALQVALPPPTPREPMRSPPSSVLSRPSSQTSPIGSCPVTCGCGLTLACATAVLSLSLPSREWATRICWSHTRAAV